MQIHYSKNSFCLAKQIRDRIEIAQERTSFWPTARRACARRAARIHQGKINGRHFVPPTIWLSKSRKVLSWCIYTTTLEPILSETDRFAPLGGTLGRGGISPPNPLLPPRPRVNAFWRKNLAPKENLAIPFKQVKTGEIQNLVLCLPHPPSARTKKLPDYFLFPNLCLNALLKPASSASFTVKA